MAIDWKFISEKEGSSRKGYVPDPTTSQSGVTIACGVDLGQRSSAEIRAWPISEGLKAKLLPYAGFIREPAAAMLALNPLEITQAEVEELDKVVREPIIKTLKTLYDQAVSGTGGRLLFDNLPDAAQTVIASVAFQYGAHLEKRTPRFWAALCSQDWVVCVHELENFGDRYATRRLSEAKLLRTVLPVAGDS